MKSFLKSIFNLTTILRCYIDAIGYGIGYNVPNYFGLHPLICIGSCLILGTIFDFLGNKILLSRIFKASTKGKISFVVIIYSIYLIAWFFVDWLIDYDLDHDFLLNLCFILFFQIIAFVIEAIKSKIKNKDNINEY